MSGVVQTKIRLLIVNRKDHSPILNMHRLLAVDLPNGLSQNEAYGSIAAVMDGGLRWSI